MVTSSYLPGKEAYPEIIGYNSLISSKFRGLRHCGHSDLRDSHSCVHGAQKLWVQGRTTLFMDSFKQIAHSFICKAAGHNIFRAVVMVSATTVEHYLQQKT